MVGRHLARSGRARHEQVVSARDGDFERAAGDGLPLDVFEIRGGLFPLPGDELRRIEGQNGPDADEMFDDFPQRMCGIDLRAAEIPRFFRVPGGDHEAGEPVRLCRNENGQEPRNGSEISREGELTQKDDVLDVCAEELFARLQEADGDRKIEARALFFEIGGREIDRDPVHGEEEPAVFEGGAHALLALLHCGVRKPHHVVRGDALIDVRLHFNGNPFEPVERITNNFRDHNFPLIFLIRRVSPSKTREAGSRT